MVFPDPDAALENALERIEALEHAHALLDKQHTGGLEAIEARLRRFADWEATTRHHNDQIDGLLGDVERNRKLVARIEALERNHDTNADTLSKVLAYFEDAPMPRAAERERRQRWHEAHLAYAASHTTYRKAKPGELTNGDSELVPNLAYTHYWAKSFADFLHGPLKAKPEPMYENTGAESEADSRGELIAKLEDTLGAERRQVAALVKAARDVLSGKATDVDSAGDRYVIDTTLKALERALKPFETQELVYDTPVGPLRITTDPSVPPDTVVMRSQNTAHPSDFEKPGVYADRIVGHVERIPTTPTFNPCPEPGCTLWVNHAGKHTGGE